MNRFPATSLLFVCLPTAFFVGAAMLPGAAEAAPAGGSEAPALPFKLNQPYRYQFAERGTPIGTFEFTVTAAEGAGPAAYRVVSKMNVAQGGKRHILQSDLLVGQDLRPTAYTVNGKMGNIEYQVECRFKGGKVEVSGRQGEISHQTTVDLPEGWEAFDNNALATWSLLGARMGVAPGATLSKQLFHALSAKVLNCTFDFKGEQTLQVGAQSYRTIKCVVPEVRNTLWLAANGLLVKGEQGSLTYTLQP